MFKDVFSQLLQIKNVSAYKVSKDTGISSGLISYWKSGEKEPSTKNLEKLSEYFGVTVDYLLGKEDYEQSLNAQLDGLDFALHNESKNLSTEDKEDVLSYIRFKKSQKGLK